VRAVHGLDADDEGVLAGAAVGRHVDDGVGGAAEKQPVAVVVRFLGAHDTRRLAGPESFKYAESLGRDAIRLIQIKDRSRFALGSRRKRLELDIAVFPLDHAPPYRALSYTWGPPLPGQPPYADTGKRPIRVAGGRLLVLPNLRDALAQLQENFRRSGIFREGPRYLWIDELCINQDDVFERAAQVSVMDRVYSQAAQTVVWLGNADGDTTKARKLLEKIVQIPGEETKAMNGVARGVRPDKSYFSARGLPDADTSDEKTRQRWRPIIELLERAWFTRSWIVQEVLLSRDIVGVCGPWSFSFFELVYTASFLGALSMHHYAENVIRDVKPGKGESQVIIDPTNRVLQLWGQ
jgi:hypothetical protein